MSDEESKFEYQKINAYFKIIDSIINDMKNRFSVKNLKIGVGVYSFIQLKFKEVVELMNKYEVPLNLKIY